MKKIKRNKEAVGFVFSSKEKLTVEELFNEIKEKLDQFLTSLAGGKHKFELWYRLNNPHPCTEQNTYLLLLSQYRDKDSLWKNWHKEFGNYIPDSGTMLLSNLRALPLLFFDENSITVFEERFIQSVKNLSFKCQKEDFEITDRFLRHCAWEDIGDGFMEEDDQGKFKPIVRIAVLVPSFFGDAEQYLQGKGDWLLAGYKEKIQGTAREKWIYLYEQYRMVGTLKEWEEELYDYQIEKILPDEEDIKTIHSFRQKLKPETVKSLLVLAAQKIIDHPDLKIKLKNVSKGLGLM